MPKLSPRYLDTVAMFEARDDDSLRYAATAFFCRYFTGGADGRTLLFLVTSGRAVAGELEDTSLVCRRRRVFRRFTYPLDGQPGPARGDWLVDSERDVAVLPLDPERLAADRIRYETFDVWGGALEGWDLQRRGVGEGDEVLVLGFTPERLRSSPATMVRRGVIARIQDFYRGQSPTFLVDATTFAGNTGSPVVIRPARGRHGTPLSHPRFHLIGLVSGAMEDPEGPVRQDHDGGTVLVRVQTGLVRVVPADAIHRLVQRAAEGHSP